MSCKADWYFHASCPLPPVADGASGKSSAQRPMSPMSPMCRASCTSVNSAKTKLHTHNFTFDGFLEGCFFIYILAFSVLHAQASVQQQYLRLQHEASKNSDTKEISPCKTEMVMTIYSNATILRKFPLIGAITDNIHRHQSKNNTFDLDSCTLKGQEGKKKILGRTKWIFEAVHEKGTT